MTWLILRFCLFALIVLAIMELHYSGYASIKRNRILLHEIQSVLKAQLFVHIFKKAHFLLRFCFSQLSF